MVSSNPHGAVQRRAVRSPGAGRSGPWAVVRMGAAGTLEGRAERTVSPCVRALTSRV